MPLLLPLQQVMLLGLPLPLLPLEILVLLLRVLQLGTEQVHLALEKLAPIDGRGWCSAMRWSHRHWRRRRIAITADWARREEAVEHVVGWRRTRHGRQHGWLRALAQVHHLAEHLVVQAEIVVRHMRKSV